MKVAKKAGVFEEAARQGGLAPDSFYGPVCR
jgi:hypothetical protein